VYWHPEPGSTEYKAYGPLPEVIATFHQLRDKAEKDNGKAFADEFWKKVMDYPGGDSLGLARRSY
jgi:hypothetical protein